MSLNGGKKVAEENELKDSDPLEHNAQYATATLHIGIITKALLLFEGPCDDSSFSMIDRPKIF